MKPKKQGKTEKRKYSAISGQVAKVFRVSQRYVQQVMKGDRENEDIKEAYLFLERKQDRDAQKLRQMINN